MYSVKKPDGSKPGDVEDGELQEDFSCLYNEIREKGQASHIQDSCSITTMFEIKFRNGLDYSRLQQRLVEVLSGAFGDQHLVFKANAIKLSIEAQELAQEKRSTRDIQDVNHCHMEQDLFLIDTVPASKLNAAQIPSYKRCQAEVLDEKTPIRKRLKAEAVNKCFRPKLQASCFNCGDSDHSLRECPRPRNNSRIQRARKKINNRPERYHVDTEQRFGHIRAGRITTKTRHAMGYGRGELPFIFYRLRVLGYPPAWLEEAKIQGSGITLFNADGSAVLKSDDEDGEADSFKYDLSKIVDFPGFNVQPSGKFFDDFQHHNVPRFKESQLKENFIKSLGDNVIKGYKRKKLINLPTLRSESVSFCIEPSEDSTNCIQHDMEIFDDSEDPLTTKRENTETLPSKEKEHTRRLTSPTLEDLTAQQELLLQQLGSNATTRTPIPSEVTPNSFKASYEGTPIIKFSIYDKLPMGENFKVGVSDVINFENLPDSTGKYERMKDLLRNVREKMTQLQNDD